MTRVRERGPSAGAEERLAFTRSHDRAYTALAGVYDVAVRRLPVWRRWLERALPHVEGPRVLEVSFGTGYLLTRYAGRVEAHGVDFNRRMLDVARRNLERAGLRASLVRGNVETLPYPDASFDGVVNTMALSGYPDARRALAEMRRVLRPGGLLVLIDVGHPADGNRLGRLLAETWRLAGDRLRDVDALLAEQGFRVQGEAIGGAGSVRMWRARRS